MGIPLFNHKKLYDSVDIKRRANFWPAVFVLKSLHHAAHQFQSHPIGAPGGMSLCCGCGMSFGFSIRSIA